MKRNTLLICFMLLSLASMGQNKQFRFGFSAGGSIQHYNGNLGNSFFKFGTCAFSGVTTNLGIYLSKALDLNIGNSIGHYGYIPTEEDLLRTVPTSERCPGDACKEFAGMGNLRSQIVSTALGLRFKFANGFMLKEEARFAPFLTAGMGLNLLSDVMRRDCVNPGLHFSLNGGGGLQFNITRRWNVAYVMDIACFATKKVYATNSNSSGTKTESTDPEIIKLQKRKDLCLRSAITVGFNF